MNINGKITIELGIVEAAILKRAINDYRHNYLLNSLPVEERDTVDGVLISLDAELKGVAEYEQR